MYGIFSKSFNYKCYYYSEKNITFDLFREQNCGTMEVYIKLLDKKIITIYTDPNEYVANLKKKIENRIGTSVDRQKLYFNRQFLKNDNIIGDFVREGSEISLLYYLW